MKIKLNYKRRDEEVEELSNVGLSSNYINFAINADYKDGVEGQLKRIIGRIQRKLDEAVEKDQDKIDFEQAEIDIITKAFEKVKVPPNLLKYWVVLEDEINALNTEENKKK